MKQKTFDTLMKALVYILFGGAMWLHGFWIGKDVAETKEAIRRNNHEFMKWCCEGVKEGIRRLEETDAKR